MLYEVVGLFTRYVYEAMKSTSVIIGQELRYNRS